MKPDAFTVLYKMLAYANPCLEEGVSTFDYQSG